MSDFEKTVRSIIDEPGKTSQLNVRTPISYQTAMDMLAAHHGITKSEILRRCMKIGLEAYLLASDNEKLVFIRSGSGKRQVPILVKGN